MKNYPVGNELSLISGSMINSALKLASRGTPARFGAWII